MDPTSSQRTPDPPYGTRYEPITLDESDGEDDYDKNSLNQAGPSSGRVKLEQVSSQVTRRTTSPLKSQRKEVPTPRTTPRVRPSETIDLTLSSEDETDHNAQPHLSSQPSRRRSSVKSPTNRKGITTIDLDPDLPIAGPSSQRLSTPAIRPRHSDVPKKGRLGTWGNPVNIANPVEVAQAKENIRARARHSTQSQKHSGASRLEVSASDADDSQALGTWGNPVNSADPSQVALALNNLESTALSQKKKVIHNIPNPPHEKPEVESAHNRPARPIPRLGQWGNAVNLGDPEQLKKVREEFSQSNRTATKKKPRGTAEAVRNTSEVPIDPVLLAEESSVVPHGSGATRPERLSPLAVQESTELWHIPVTLGLNLDPSIGDGTGDGQTQEFEQPPDDMTPNFDDWVVDHDTHFKDHVPVENAEPPSGHDVPRQEVQSDIAKEPSNPDPAQIAASFEAAPVNSSPNLTVGDPGQAVKRQASPTNSDADTSSNRKRAKTQHVDDQEATPSLDVGPRADEDPSQHVKTSDFVIPSSIIDTLIPAANASQSTKRGPTWAAWSPVPPLRALASSPAPQSEPMIDELESDSLLDSVVPPYSVPSPSPGNVALQSTSEVLEPIDDLTGAEEAIDLLLDNVTADADVEVDTEPAPLLQDDATDLVESIRHASPPKENISINEPRSDVAGNILPSAPLDATHDETATLKSVAPDPPSDTGDSSTASEQIAQEPVQLEAAEEDHTSPIALTAEAQPVPPVKIEPISVDANRPGSPPHTVLTQADKIMLDVGIRASLTSSPAPSIQEIDRRGHVVRAISASPIPEFKSIKPPNMDTIQWLRLRAKTKIEQSSHVPAVVKIESPIASPVPAVFSPPVYLDEGVLPFDSEITLTATSATNDEEKMSREEWRRIVDEDGASDVEVLLDTEGSSPPRSGSSSERVDTGLDTDFDTVHPDMSRWQDPTQMPPPERRGEAKRLFDNQAIDTWNQIQPHLTRNPALHREVFEMYISQREIESGTIRIVNDVDSEGIPPDTEFEYSNDMLYNQAVPDPEKGLGCGCEGPCDPRSRSCSCVKRQERYFYGINDLHGFAYDAAGKVRNLSVPIWECGETCGCPPECMNRVIQRGRSPATKLEIVKTKLKGWGVQAGAKIPKGTFIGIYSGELITEEDSEARGELYSEIGRTYVFDLDGWQIRNPPAGLRDIDPRLAEIAEASAERARLTVADVGNANYVYNAYSVDAFHCGYTRFFNHSCDPNLEITQCYVKDFHPERPLLVIFARRDIFPKEELCISYKGIIEDDEDEVESEFLPEKKTTKKGKKRQSKTSASAHISTKSDESNAKMDKNTCLCGAWNCDGKMFNL